MGARSAITASPAIFLPRISGLAPDQLGKADHLALGVRQLDSNHASAGDCRDSRRERRHVPRDIVGKRDYAARLDAARRLELVHRDHGARTDFDNVAAHVEVLKHGLKQARIPL
jgi:hypothetical protein